MGLSSEAKAWGRKVAQKIQEVAKAGLESVERLVRRERGSRSRSLCACLNLPTHVLGQGPLPRCAARS